MVVHPTVALEGAQSTVVAETLAATVCKRKKAFNMQFSICNIYVDGNIRKPALPVMPRQYQSKRPSLT